MEEGVRIDIRLLRDYMSAVVEEKRLAQQLYSKVEGLCRMCDDSEKTRYYKLLRDVEVLLVYYARLEDSLQNVELNTIAIHNEITARLRDETDEVKRMFPGSPA